MTLRASLFQLLRFGAVGLAATVAHASVYSTLVELSATHPAIANLLAFSCAFALSFAGHFLWTFGAKMRARKNLNIRGPLIRFLIVALAGLTLNALFVFLISNILQLRPVYAVFPMIMITPLFTFILSQKFAFRD
ncbi:GtrA family protein [uncultured Roseobacter sp.]|uniref:GtrA family protein n=1 Tax=uncultured Roseobacter sp. TaxID=114847 RepID=UPI00262EC018|nr:GtrA family protein [uncultured Roseobacter sp.]